MPFVLICVRAVRNKTAPFAAKVELVKRSLVDGAADWVPFATAKRAWTHVFTNVTTPVPVHVIECWLTGRAFDFGAKFAAGDRQIACWIGHLLVRGYFERLGGDPNVVMVGVATSPKIYTLASFLRKREQVERDR